MSFRVIVALVVVVVVVAAVVVVLLSMSLSGAVLKADVSLIHYLFFCC